MCRRMHAVFTRLAGLGLRWIGLAPVFILCAASSAAWTQGRTEPEVAWASYQNHRFGFSIRYPESIFGAEPKTQTRDGQVWVSRDGSARLIASAGINSTAESIESYRQYVMETSYPGAHFDYSPLHSNWFVLSGKKGDRIFYERITFACGGRYIYGWQMSYPVSVQRLYDRVVEGVHRSYRPGKGENGDCR